MRNNSSGSDGCWPSGVRLLNATSLLCLEEGVRRWGEHSSWRFDRHPALGQAAARAYIPPNSTLPPLRNRHQGSRCPTPQSVQWARPSPRLTPRNSARVGRLPWRQSAPEARPTPHRIPTKSTSVFPAGQAVLQCRKGRPRLPGDSLAPHVLGPLTSNLQEWMTTGYLLLQSLKAPPQ